MGHIVQSTALTLALLLVIGVVFFMGMEADRCSDRGGKLVRSLVWFECVDSKP